MKYLPLLKCIVPLFLLIFLCSSANAQQFSNGTLSPTASPRAEIMTWLAQHRVKAKSISNTTNQQNWGQGPQIVITGNATTDHQNYQSVKATWIQQNQAAYTDAQQQQIQYMQGGQQSNARVDKFGEKRRVTSGNGFLIPSQSQTPVDNQ